MNRPQIMAHRGDCGKYKENTLAALSSAMDAGLQYIECDLQINGSGTPVLLHDASLERTHRLDRSVFDCMDDSLPVLPTLPELISLAGEHSNVRLCLEIKHDSIDHWGVEQVISRLQPVADDLRQHVLFARSTDFLCEVRQAGMPTVGVILQSWSAELRGQLFSMAPDFLVINCSRVPPDEPLWPGPWRWAVYEIGDWKTAVAWGMRGADYVLSHNCVQLNAQRQATQP